jgi:uncharacterized membrane protein YkvA (DUF1232 family)
MGTNLVQPRSQQKRRSLAVILKAQARQLFKQFRILTRALVHPGVPWYAKLVCGCAVLYVASPIQLIPSFIPIIGQLDDVLVVCLSIRFLKRSVPPTVLDECQNGSRLPLVSAIPLNLPISPFPDFGPDALRKDSVNKSLPSIWDVPQIEPSISCDSFSPATPAIATLNRTYEGRNRP